MSNIGERCGARTRACRVETLLDTRRYLVYRRRHECRRGTHECARHVRIVGLFLEEFLGEVSV
jgi:hypothetical protein